MINVGTGTFLQLEKGTYNKNNIGTAGVIMILFHQIHINVLNISPF